jgi:molecular chaperone DnaK (HSP70)
MTSGNPILKKDIDPLKQRIDLINKLTRDELKELYKDTMSEGIYENQEGAGLGIMKMAKITRNKINYSIDPIKDDIFFYTIEIRIPT